jgi:hypothetical protein
MAQGETGGAFSDADSFDLPYVHTRRAGKDCSGYRRGCENGIGDIAPSMLVDFISNSPHQDDAAVAAPLKNASRSVLICSAFVVGMPCGKPL